MFDLVFAIILTLILFSMPTTLLWATWGERLPRVVYVILALIYVAVGTSSVALIGSAVSAL